MAVVKTVVLLRYDSSPPKHNDSIYYKSHFSKYSALLLAEWLIVIDPEIKSAGKRPLLFAKFRIFFFARAEVSIAVIMLKTVVAQPSASRVASDYTSAALTESSAKFSRESWLQFRTDKPTSRNFPSHGSV